MSYINNFLNGLKDKGVVVLLKDNESLQVKSKKGVLTPDIVSELKSLKEDIIEYLRSGVGREYICSFQQERLCFLDKFEEGKSEAYNMPSLFVLRGELDIKSLERSFREIIKRHEVLRSNFFDIDGSFYQVVGDYSRFKIEKEEIREENIEEKIDKLLKKPFNLRDELLFRVNLFRVDRDKHYLFINMHHIVSDGWSIDIMTREFIYLYNQFTNNLENQLEPLKIQYGDYAKWQRDYLSGEKLNEKLEFWRESLKDIEVLELPTQYPRPSIQSYRGKRVSFEIDSTTTQKLKELTKKYDLTLFMTLFSSFAIMLYRYSGQKDIVIGSPMANRNHVDIEKLIGFFVNSLPIRVKIDEDSSFLEFLQRVKSDILDIYEYQDVPFEKIVEALNIPRDTSYSPIFQTMFILQNNKQESITLPNLELKNIEIENNTSKFDLSLELKESEGRLEGILEYSLDIFSDLFMQRFIENFKVLLEGISSSEHKKLWEYNIISQKEREELSLLNQTKREYPREKSVNKIFEEQVKKYPNKVALRYKDRDITYSELNNKANQLAHYLLSKGIKKGDIVALFMDRSIEMIAGILGTIKAGGAYLPIDTNYPKERIDYLLEDSNAFIKLSQDDVKMAFELNISTSNPNIDIKATDLIYLIYTSGSTGKPKGVMVEHRGVNRLVLAQEYVPFDENIIMLQSNSISFDVATFDIFGALLVGGTLVLYPDNKLDLKLLNQTIQKYNINTMWLTSALFEQWVFDLDIDLDSLKYLLAGGDIVNSYAVNMLHKKLPNITIIDGYGPTENTTFTTTYRCSRGIEYSEIPIGKPINNTTVYILDKHLNLVPKGVVGELYTGGDGVARGYFKNSELTKERFIEFGDDRVYKSGDLVKYREDNNILYLGREDNQVKIRGFRVELGEIEQQILQIEGVKESVVLERDKQLVTYITIENGYILDDLTLKRELKEFLPEYMIPISFNILEKMPINPNGKVDRRALAKLEVKIESKENFVAPRDSLEEKLSDIFKEVLNIERVGIYDDFFELGGHSLLATKLTAYIKNQLKVEVPLRVIFANPTILGIKEYIRDNKESKKESKIVKRGKTQAPLSFAQERLWFLDKFEESASISYNMPVLLRLEGELDFEILEKSLNSIIKRHEILRTNFIEIDSTPYQVVKEHTLKVQKIKTDNIQLEIEKILSMGFDLDRDLLFGVYLFEKSDNSRYLFVNMHHIISDGWSIDIMIREFVSLYSAFVANKENPLTPLEIQYSDYAIWQRENLRGDILNQKLEYWRENLEGIEPLLLPTQYQRLATPTYRGDRVNLKIDRETTKGLYQISKEYQATLFMTLLSAFGLLMQKYSNQKDIVIGSPIANRQEKVLENLIGFFVNVLPFRVKIDTDRDFLALLSSVKETTLNGYEHQDTPFEKILDSLNIPRDSSISPVFQVMFVLQNNQESALELDNLKIEPVEFKNPTSKFDLSLELKEREGELKGAIEYATDLFSREFVEQIAKDFKKLLFQVVKDSKKPIREYSLVKEDNFTLEIKEPKTTLHKEIEKEVEKQGDKEAIRFEGESLSYRELNSRANRVANYLIEKGIEIEDIVALRLDRSFEMIVGILGVLKAGGAYLPMDIEYPEERVEYILENSKAKEVLTKEKIREISKDSRYSVKNPDREVKESNLAYVIYTSGSTGKPKGVGVEHKGAVNRIEWQIREMSIDSSDRILQKTPYTFDVSVWELLLPLMCGAVEVIAKPKGHKDSRYISEIIEKEKITTIHFVPSMLSVINEEPLFIKNSKNLKRVVCSGEALPLKLVREYYKLHSTPIYNLYGPTEASIDVSYYLCPKDTTNLETIPIGKAIDNIRLHILDSNLNRVPKGVVGELYIEGIGVAREYINNPELTKNSFITHRGKRLYKSGDLVKELSDGNIEYIGRNDNQIKLRGLRIDLGEIESQLQNIEEIKESVVVLKDDNLIAYITTKSENIKVEEIKEELSRYLTDYMIPTHIEIIDVMPLTPNGKADRKALKNREIELKSKREFVAPRDKTEEKLSNIFKELLEVERVGVYDDFFELGGHSLLATQLVSKIRSVFGVEVALKDIFRYSDIVGIKELIQNSKTSLLPKIKKYRDKSNIPLSYSQERLWFLDKFENGESNSYSMPILLKVTGNIDFDRVKSVFREIVERHEILRTNFRGFQYIHTEPNFEFKEIEIKENQRDRVVQELISTPFDLENGSLFRVYILKIDSKNSYIFINMHHIISDGWSLEVLVKEFQTLYSNKKLKPLEIQYGDFAIWQRENLSGKVLEEKLDFFREELRDIEPLNLPTTYKRPPILSHRGDRVKFKIDSNITAKLNSISRRYNATLFMTLISAFGLLLNRYTHDKSIVIGSPVANRNYLELEELIGFFVNSLPIKIDIEDSITFSQLLKNSKEKITELFNYQDVPFEKIVEALNIPRDTSYSPIFQVMFVLQNIKQTKLQLPNIDIDVVDFKNPTSKFDLIMELTEKEDFIEGSLEYSSDIFSREFIEAMSRHFVNLLEEITKNENRVVHRYNILTPEEKRELLYDFNQTKVDYPGDKTIPELFIIEAKKTPLKVAIKYKEEYLSYKELDSKSNQIANYLIERGLKRGDIVAIYMDRSIEMIVSVIAILKAGGAYLILDKNYPKERVEYMTKDSNAITTLTKEDIEFIYKKYSSEFDIVDIDSNDLAYVVYTSGSTGRPKGVIGTHKNIIRLVKSQNYTKFDNTIKTLQLSSPSFDAFTFDIFAPLLNGGELSLYSKEHIDITHLNSDIKRYGVNALFMTSALFEQWANSTDEELESLRYILTGGERVNPNAVYLSGKKFPNINIVDVYGPTENTTFTTTYTCKKGVRYRDIPIGKPINNTTVYILDKHLNLVPKGVIGELYTGGDGVARGYMNLPELTQERFIEYRGERVYKSGDLVRYNQKGEVEYIKRADNQIKIRGYRVELDEIEKQILGIDGIRESAVVFREGNIIAFVVGETKGIKEALGSSLPEYMIPTHIEYIKEMPLTSNGKIDKKQLSKIDIDFRKKEYIAPKDNIQKKLVEIYESVLDIKGVGIADNFFELGGNSILSIEVINLAKRADINIEVSDIFIAPTIEKLSKRANRADIKKRILPQEEAILEEDIKPIDSKIELNKNILLTGATGFLGSYILSQLLQDRDNKISLLVRGESIQKAKERVESVMREYNLYQDDYLDRVEFILGDLSKPNLGIEENLYNRLSKEITQIYHSASYLNSLVSYEILKEVNVAGVKEILRFASKGVAKKIEYISTVDVFTYRTQPIVDENTDVTKQIHFRDNGYASSKFIAENVLLLAKERGFNINIYRVGLITGDTKLGKNEKSQWFYNLIDSIKKIDCMVDIKDFEISITPVDYIAKSVTSLSKYENEIFHISSPFMVKFTDLVKFQNIDIVDFYTFIQKIKAYNQTHKEELYLTQFVNEMLDFSKEEADIFENEQLKMREPKPLLRTIYTTKKLDIDFPIIDEELLGKYF